MARAYGANRDAVPFPTPSVAPWREGSMGAVENLRTRLRSPGPRLVLPEGGDPRVVEAAMRIAASGIARPIVLGDHAAVEGHRSRLGLDSATVAMTVDEALTAEAIDAYVAIRPVPRSVAERMLRRPETLAATMVRMGRADTLLAGVTATTHDVLAACDSVVGYAQGVRHASSFFLVETFDGRPFLFADCAIHPDPSAEALADIAVRTAASARRLLGCEPRVAMLSFSTHGSAAHPSVDKVRLATELALARDPRLCIDGEMQADAAVDAFAAAHKLAPVGPVAGHANVLIFPNLDAGNVAYKLVRSLGHARALGVILQGYRSPVADASRGATVNELVDTAVVLAALTNDALTRRHGHDRIPRSCTGN